MDKKIIHERMRRLASYELEKFKKPGVSRYQVMNKEFELSNKIDKVMAELKIQKMEKLLIQMSQDLELQRIIEQISYRLHLNGGGHADYMLKEMIAEEGGGK